MEGLYIHKAKKDTMATSLNVEDDIDESLSLLAKHQNIEIMTQTILKGAVVWLSPGTREDSFEFFFVHEGELEIVDDSMTTVIGPGDSFFANNIKQNIKLHCLKNAVMLYMSNCIAYDDVYYWEQNLQDLINRINEKDHYTKGHSHRVLGYAIKIRERLESVCKWMSYDDFVVACLFHDVGKCNVPSEILLKPSRLTNDEYNVIKKHPLDSYRILEPVFGEAISTLTRMHHERLDGRGYPYGLKADDIPMEARILMVADAFDAMTSKRPYNVARTYQSAAEELAGMTAQYDVQVTRVLLDLVTSGAIILDEDNIGRKIAEGRM
ncbi:MAG: hypothetical protein CW338_02800 [Clostridiales bacterium]|nr:hypothetical protein [Clostridiales bacterium]